MKNIASLLFKLFFLRDLKGRYISAEQPEQGRFTKRQLTELYRKIKEEQARLQTQAGLSQYRSHGNRLMVYCGAMSIAAYRELRKDGLSHQYATRLVADVLWKLYILGAKSLWLITGLIARDPRKRLNYTLRMLCIYPFNRDPNGYQFKIQIKPDHLAMDFTQCVVHQFIVKTGNDEEMDFFRNSWCLYDFALPACLTAGGGYKREHTLSHGDNICDMKWYAESVNPGSEKQASSPR